MEERYSNLELLEQPEVPGWFRKGEIDEVLFCQIFLALYPMLCIGDSFFGEDGLISPRIIEQMIYDEIKPYVHKNVSKTVRNLVDALSWNAN